MTAPATAPATRPVPAVRNAAEHDPRLLAIADYACGYRVDSLAALDAARARLADALAVACAALREPACVRLLGPVVPGATMVGGARVPGTSFELDPVKAAFDCGAMLGWPGPVPRPAEVLGGLLPLADWWSRRRVAEGHGALSVRELLAATVKAAEIREVVGERNPLADRGCDDSFHLRLATTAVATALLCGTREQVASALSHAVLDGVRLRTPPDAPDAAAHRARALGDAASRGVRLALLALAGHPGCPAALAAPDRGFESVVLVRPFDVDAPLATQAIEAPAPALALEPAVTAHYGPKQAKAILALFADAARLDALPVPTLLSTLARP